MSNFDGCQLPIVPNLSEGTEPNDARPLIRRLKRALAAPWNYRVKPWLKKIYRLRSRSAPGGTGKPAQAASDAARQQDAPPGSEAGSAPSGKLKAGDWVRVRSWEEIQPMLDPFKETRGCAFLGGMRQYCNTKQRVFKSMERFLDERDYKVKKTRGVILLENVICEGTPAFGRCDRSCFLFWREEWLEKIDE